MSLGRIAPGKERLSRRGFLSVAGMAVEGTATLNTGLEKASVTVGSKPNVLDTVDVLVIGGGPAGIGGALGAARTP